MRVENHPILEEIKNNNKILIYVDGKPIEALESDTVASALIANNIKICRYTRKYNEPRGVFCAIGRCNDCLVTIDGIPNQRACITPVFNGMKISTQIGNGVFGGNK